MEDKTKGKPGPKPKLGAPLSGITVKLTQALHAKVQANGGSPWVRELIIKAKDVRK
jgi:hypothetical protein